MGLLGTSWDDPQTLAVMQLAGGLLSGGNFGQALGKGLAGYTAQLNQADERKTLKEYRDAQKANIESEIEARKAATAKAAQKQAIIDSVFGGRGVVSPGAFVPSVGGMGPTMPPQMQRSGGLLGNLTPDDVARLKVADLDIQDIYKWAQEPQQLQQGSTYQNRTTGQREYIPKIGEGVAPDQNGFYGPLPGYAQAQATIEGKKAQAIEQAKAGFDLVDVPMGLDGTRRMTRTQAVKSFEGGPTSLPGDPTFRNTGNAIMSPELEAFVRQQAIKDGVDAPTFRFDAPQAGQTLGLQSSNFGRTPSPAETAKAVKTAEADVGRDTQVQTEQKRFKQMMSGVDMAESLLKQGPTASGAGAFVDGAASFFGKSTKGANVAAQLDTLSGWMVSNVPRMEGPQSDKDVQNYRIQAAMVGDRTKPVEQRLAALTVLRELQNKYAGINGGNTAQSGGGATGGWGGSQPSAGAPTMRWNPKTGRFDAIQ